MTETPASTRKRVRFNDKNDEDVVIVEPEPTNRKLPPSLQAHSVVTTAVASHPLPIQELAAAILQTSNSLKSQQQQQEQTRIRLSDATFIPRSA